MSRHGVADVVLALLSAHALPGMGTGNVWACWGMGEVALGNICIQFEEKARHARSGYRMAEIAGAMMPTFGSLCGHFIPAPSLTDLCSCCELNGKAYCWTMNPVGFFVCLISVCLFFRFIYIKRHEHFFSSIIIWIKKNEENVLTNGRRRTKRQEIHNGFDNKMSSSGI